MTLAAATPGDVIARRRRERAAAIDVARRFVEAVRCSLDVRAAVVIGSTARGDFNKWSDIDVVVVAQHLPDDPFERTMALGTRPPHVQCVVWTPQDYALVPRDAVRSDRPGSGELWRVVDR